MTPGDPTTVTVADAAAQLNVTTRAVLHYIKAGKLDASKPAKQWLIDRNSLNRHLASTASSDQVDSAMGLSGMAELDAAHRENELLRAANEDLRTQLAETKRRLHHMGAALAEVATADINLDHV